MPTHSYMQLPPLMYQVLAPTPVAGPYWLAFNPALAEFLQLPDEWCHTQQGLELFAGNQLAPWCQPLALAYSGHQFGQLNPRLGDGRALLIAQVCGRDGQWYDIQLKGAGPTPFSRRGDGRAAQGPVLREYMLSEWMHAVGVPTSRALAAVGTGEHVYRDRPLPGAVLTRVATSHLRIGSMQYVSMFGSAADVSALIKFSLARHYPQAWQAESDDIYRSNAALALLSAVTKAQASLLARWMQLGFVHGVMNTDNMSLSGETIDYGPCAFLDGYIPETTFSSIDSQGRYAYRNQPAIAQWNLARLAEALLAQIHPNEQDAIALVMPVLNQFVTWYQQAFYHGFATKLGLINPRDSSDTSPDISPDKSHEISAETRQFIDETLQLLQAHAIDFTAFFRRLASARQGNPTPLLALTSEPTVLTAWLDRWQAIVAVDADALLSVNPAFIPRNQTVEAILARANDGDLAPLQRFIAAAQTPFVDADEWMQIPTPAPYRTFCGT